MLFNSLEFAIFLPIVFILYWFVFKNNLKLQNFFLLAVSYFFYGWWDWRFLSLIAFSSLADYLIGLQIHKTEERSKRKLFLSLSLLINLGFLGFFKYYNFFAENFVDAFSLLGQEFDARRLEVILPVGISFYTFQTLSYTIDVYKKKLEPTKDIITFFAYVSFFPQLVAGPIERAKNLLPQFYKKRTFSYAQASDGVKQILWGLFMKVAIADSCAVFVEDIFNNYEKYPGGVLLLGGGLFAIQIYGDFAGYSNIAIGIAKLLGFELMQNFAFPYFSRDMGEFWRRWHISLSTWFRDYLYIPLGGSRGGIWMKIRNTFIIFLVSGFWHGANWTFVMWGFINACYFLPLLLAKQNRSNLDVVAEDRILPNFKEIAQMLLTFLLSVFAWIFFRAPDISTAFIYIQNIFQKFHFRKALIFEEIDFYVLLINILVLFILEWINRRNTYGLKEKSKYVIINYLGYFYLLDRILNNLFSEQTFIYFQF